MKERGLFALLLLSPGQCCARTWMQDKLWSDRSPEQSSTSLRQALSKLRKALGPLGDRLYSDRFALWIDPPLPQVGMPNPALGELLQDIDIGLVPVSFRSFDSNTHHQGDRIWQRYTATSSSGMVRLNEVMEFGEIDSDRQTEALDFVRQAARLVPDAPVILAMASEVTLFLSGDVDMAGFFANRAVAVDDQDPEALAAYGRTLSFQGKNAEAHRVALAARHNAQGSPYSYDWDLMAGIAKIRLGDLAGAFGMMLSCHRKMPFGRQALRYLTVLSLLADRDDDALRFAGRLRRLEPDFNFDLLRGNYAPLAFKRDMDLMDMVRHKLTP